MSGPPLVSVVIPCYNGERFIRETIESALAQTHPAVETIVIDDGSTDGSLAAIKSFGDRVRWETGPNLGAPAARNRGIELARGAYLQLLDSDDLLLPAKIEACLAAFDLDVDGVFCGVRNIGATGPPAPERAGPSAYRLARALLRWREEPDKFEWDPARALEFFVRRGFQTSQPLHRIETVRTAGGFMPGLGCMQDYEFHVRLALGGARFKRIEPELVLYRHHDGPDRIRNLENAAAKRLDTLLKTRAELKSAGRLEGAVRRALAGRLAHFARVYYRRGAVDQAVAMHRAARETAWLPQASGSRVYDAALATLGLKRTEDLYLRLRGPGTGAEAGKGRAKTPPAGPPSR